MIISIFSPSLCPMRAVFCELDSCVEQWINIKRGFSFQSEASFRNFLGGGGGKTMPLIFVPLPIYSGSGVTSPPTVITPPLSNTTNATGRHGLDAYIYIVFLLMVNIRLLVCDNGSIYKYIFFLFLMINLYIYLYMSPCPELYFRLLVFSGACYGPYGWPSSSVHEQWMFCYC